MRVLITGATGMLGYALSEIFSRKGHEVFCTGRSICENYTFGKYFCFDFQKDDFQVLLDWCKPELIIHSAALTDAVMCNDLPEMAFQVNSFSVKKILDLMDEKTKIIYISTDAVYPSNIHMARETDYVAPENTYGKSKELGEFFVRTSTKNWLILRTTIVGFNSFTTNGSSFVPWIINELTKGSEITLFDDVLFTPISIWDFSEELTERIIHSDVRGVFNLAGREQISKYGFGIALVDKLDLNADLVKKGYISDFKMRSNRSSDQTLNVKKYQSYFQTSLPNIEETVNKICCYYEKNKIR